MGQRLLTIAVIWAVPCGATFAVIPTLAVSFFGSGGGLLVFFLIFALMFLHIMITARIFRRQLNPSQESYGLIMELPPYHKPRLTFILKQTFGRMGEVFKKAFSVVFIISGVVYHAANVFL